MDRRSVIDGLWALAEARRDAGEPPKRHLGLAYSMSPGDSEISARAWLTEDEALSLHAATQALSTNGQLVREAKERLVIRFTKRQLWKCSQLDFKP